MLGVPDGVTIGAFDALPAFSSPHATLSALGRTVYLLEAALTNFVTLGIKFLFKPGDHPIQLGNIMNIVRHWWLRQDPATASISPWLQPSSLHMHNSQSCVLHLCEHFACLHTSICPPCSL